MLSDKTNQLIKETEYLELNKDRRRVNSVTEE